MEVKLVVFEVVETAVVLVALVVVVLVVALDVEVEEVALEVLVEPLEIEAYALALAREDFGEAWSYQRTFAEGSTTRESLLRKIVLSAFKPVQREQVMALYTVPFTSYEQTSVQKLALSPDSPDDCAK